VAAAPRQSRTSAGPSHWVVASHRRSGAAGPAQHGCDTGRPRRQGSNEQRPTSETPSPVLESEVVAALRLGSVVYPAFLVHHLQHCGLSLLLCSAPWYHHLQTKT
jgi:hypothetical protein